MQRLGRLCQGLPFSVCVRVCVCARAQQGRGGGDMSENDQKQSLNFRCSEATSGQNYSSDLSASLQNESCDAKKEARERGGRINKADLRSSLECAAVRAEIQRAAARARGSSDERIIASLIIILIKQFAC